MAIAPKDQEIAALYREGGSDGPSAELDRAILQAARQALEPRPVAGWRRWRLHIPVLASLFMVALFGLLITLDQPDSPNLGQLALNETAPASPAPAAAPPSGQLAAPPAESRARMAESPAPRATAKAAIPAPPAEPAAQPATQAATANLSAGAPTAAPAPMIADAAAPAMVKAESRAARTAAAPAAPAVIAPPKEWLATIQRLLDADRIDEARSSLEAFEKAYPAETVPEAMRRRLKP